MSLEQIQKEMNSTPIIKKEVLIVDDEKEDQLNLDIKIFSKDKILIS